MESECTNQVDENLYYNPSTEADPITHFDLARATRAVTGAVGCLESPQSYISTEHLHKWASTTGSCRNAKAEEGAPQSTGLYRAFTGPDEIRVLEVKPGSASDTVRCALHHCCVGYDGTHDPSHQPGPRRHHPAQFGTSTTAPTEPIWYTALSYRWGDPKDLGSPVDVSGHEIQITKSLEQILLHIRKPDHSVMMWIDQICINQKDNDDKATQIPLMSKIYGRALNTLVWLTPSPDFPMDVNPFRHFYDFAIKLQFSENNTNPKDFQGIGLPDADSDAWREVWHVLSQPYFQRLWIIQEIALSVRPWLACGDHLTSWRIFSDACLRLHGSGVSRWLRDKFDSSTTSISSSSPEHHGPASTPPRDACYQVTSLDGIAYSPVNKLRLWVLEETRGAISYDPRDKIYGMLGLDSLSYETSGPDLLQWEVNVSYDNDNTAARLYTEIAGQILTVQKDPVATLLVNVDHYHSMNGLPSWVPDWSQPRQTISLGAGLRFANFYTTALGSPSGHSRSADGRELHMRGFAFDVITTNLTDVFHDPDISCESPAAENNHTLLSCHRLASCLETYPPSPGPSPEATTTVFEAFWRTLVADKDAPLGLQSEVARERAPVAEFSEMFSLLLDASTGVRSGTSSLPGQTYSRRQRLPLGHKGSLTIEALRPENEEEASGGRRPAGKKKLAAAFARLRAAMRTALWNRRLGFTARGYLGLFPWYVRAGDVVCALRDCHVPFVLRPAGQGQDGKERFEILGECYVHGIMNGEAVVDGEESEFVLV